MSRWAILRERTGVEKFEDVKVMENLGLLEDQQMIQWQRSTEFRWEGFGWAGHEMQPQR